MPAYYRTRHEGRVRTHLEGAGDSYTLCGLDTAGDDLIHDRDPEKLPPGKHRVTCEDCQQTIRIVVSHLGKPEP